MFYQENVTIPRFNPKYLPILIVAIVLLATIISDAQSTETLIFQQINQLRGPKHQLTYDSSKQKQVDRYAASNGFKKFIHSGMNCGEIIAASSNTNDFITLWLNSKPHKKVMLDKRGRSMACRVVEIRKGYYHAVVQFYN